MSENGISKPDDVLAARTDEVELPGGLRFRVRRISAVEMMMAGSGGDLRSFLRGGATAEAIQERMTESLESGQGRSILEAVVRTAVLEPDPSGEWVKALTYEDLDTLVGGILKLSGFTGAEAAKVAPLDASGECSKASTQSRGDTE